MLKKSSCLCSGHLNDESRFEHKSVLVENGQNIELKNNSIKGSIPKKDTVVPYKSSFKSRKRRKVSFKFYLQHVNVNILILQL